MGTTYTLDELLDCQGNPVLDVDGEVIGPLDRVYLDRDSGEPSWVSVIAGAGTAVVPLHGAEIFGDRLQVGSAGQLIRHAPIARDPDQLTPEEEVELRGHYGLLDTTGLLDRSGLQDDGADPGTGTAAGQEVQGEVTLREEQLQVSTTRRELGTVRIETDTVTEERQIVVPVQREVARVIREPAPGSAGAMAGQSEQILEVTLSEEEIHISKTTVPVETVRIERDVVTDERRVTAEVAHEELRIEQEGEGVEVEERRRG